MNAREAQAKVIELLKDPELATKKAFAFAPKKFAVGETSVYTKNYAIEAMRIAMTGETKEESAANLKAFAKSL
jgi:hypothetical protein